MKKTTILIFFIALTAHFYTQTAFAQAQDGEEIRAPLVGQPLLNSPQFRCQPGQYLYGIALNHTDRVVGLWYYCRAASDSGEWADAQAYQTRALGDTRSFATEMICPRNYFLAGLSVTTGQYTARVGGFAPSSSERMIADLQPICRHRQDEEVYRLNRSYFADAEDNDVKDIFWTGPGTGDCRLNQAASGLVIGYTGGRDLDPNNIFSNIALICRPLRIEYIQRIDPTVVPAGKP